MSTFTTSQRQIDEYTLRLGRLEDELAAAARREAALETRVLEDLHLIGRLEAALYGVYDHDDNPASPAVVTVLEDARQRLRAA
jgi:hypothetical protein